MSLYNFYRSDQWENLLKILKNERVNYEGYVICDYCGKPIVKAYDCIGHHVIHLTEENYTDYNISLNPELIQLVHHKCHNIIHDRLGMNTQRQVFLVYGSPLSGKSTWVKDNMTEGDLVIDIDSIWQCVSGQDRYTKPNRLKSVVFAVRDNLLESVKYRRGKWLNAYVIQSLPFRNERERMCDIYGARLVHIDADKETCLQRLYDNGNGRNIKEWEQYIEDYFRDYELYGL